MLLFGWAAKRFKGRALELRMAETSIRAEVNRSETCTSNRSGDAMSHSQLRKAMETE